MVEGLAKRQADGGDLGTSLVKGLRGLIDRGETSPKPSAVYYGLFGTDPICSVRADVIATVA